MEQQKITMFWELYIFLYILGTGAENDEGSRRRAGGKEGGQVRRGARRTRVTLDHTSGESEVVQNVAENCRPEAKCPALKFN